MNGSLRARLTLIVALAAFAIPLVAQMPDGGGPPGGPDGPMMGGPPDAQETPREPNARQLLGRLSKDLKLTDDQKKKIKPILDTHQHRIEELTRSSISRQEQIQKIEGIEEESWAGIRPLLNSAQDKKFDAWTKKMTERRERAAKRQEWDDDMPPPPPDGPPPGGGPGGGGPPPE